MAESSEYRTVVSCMRQLETALFKCDRDVIHFLLQEGFITTEMHDDVLNPRLLGEHQKAGELVSGIRRKVALSAQDYHTLVDLLEQSGKHYESIVAILSEEYARQQQVGDTLQAQEFLRQVPKMSYPLSRYKEYLKSYYRNYSIACDDKLFIAPCSEFISLALVKKEAFSKSTDHGNMDEIVAVKTPVELDAVFESDSRFVLVEGPPGFGKSTLCWELCRRWGLGLLRDFTIALQLKLREERVQNAQRLQEFFYHEDERLSQRVVEEVLECEGEGILLILDGFDEMPTAVLRNENSLVMKLITCRAMPKAARLVTSRPSAIFHKAKLLRNYRHVEILGFTNDCKIRFAKIAFAKNPDGFTHFKSYVVSNPIIKSLMYAPINCAIIAQVYQDISSKSVLLPKTMTQLYTILSLVLIRRHKIKTGEWNEDSEVPRKFEDLENKVLGDLKKIGKLANHLGLMSETKEMYVATGAKVTYSFFHLSMQEFLAAWYTSQHPELIEHAKINYFDKLNSSYSAWYLPAHLNAYVRFLAGLVGLSKMLAKPINDFGGGLTLLHCFFEAQNPIQDQRFLKAQNFVFIENAMDGYVFEYALTHTTVDWGLRIDTTNLGALQSLLCCHSQNYTSDLEIRPSSNSSRHLQHVCTLRLTVKDFDNIEKAATLISHMCRLSDIEISIENGVPQSFQGDYLLFKALQSIQALQSVFFLFIGYTMSNKGVNELATFFQKRNTLTSIKLRYQGFSALNTLVFRNNYHFIIESALSCPALTLFSTNIPFVTSKFPRTLKHVCFDIGDDVYTVTANLKYCICCIADHCARSSAIETLTFSAGISLWNKFSIASEVYCVFLSILNKSLHYELANFWIIFHNISCGSILNTITVLSRSLGNKFEAQESYIRRSQSLCDLATPFDFIGKKKPVSKSHSCPDLYDLYRLHSLHPQLCKEMFRDSLKIQNCKSKVKNKLGVREKKRCNIS